MNKRIKTLFMLLFVLTFLSKLAPGSYAENNSKLLIISSDSVGISDIGKIKSNNSNISAGLLSLKSMNRNEENIFINMAYGRTYGYSESKFNNIDYSEGTSVGNYKGIMNAIEKEYSETNKDIKCLGDILKENNLKRSFLGGKSGNSNTSYILLSDSDGKYDFGHELKSEDIIHEVDAEFQKADVVMVSLSDFERETQLSLSRSLMSMNYESILISTKKSDYGYMKNKSISAVLARRSGWSGGFLTSDSTKREGLISSLDIKSTILEKFRLTEENSTGKPMKSIDTDENVQEVLAENLESYMNLNLTKYIFHGFIIGINILIILSYLMKKNIEKKVPLSYLPPAFVLFGMALSFMNGNIFLYSGLILVLSVGLLAYYKREADSDDSKNIMSGKFEIEYIECVPFISNILIIMGIFFAKNLIYGSFIGYNNIDAGGRYYGFNNDIMGVLLATGILSAGMFNNKIKSIWGKYIGFLVLMINLMALTGSYGSNFGGMLTAITAVILYVYYFISKSTMGVKRVMAMLGTIAITILLFYLVGGSNSHFAEFFDRVADQGWVEFFDMMKKKITQLIQIAVMPPWSVMIILQSIYIIKRIRSAINKRDIKLLKLIYITSIAALMLNDTGAIAFMYMNAYSIALIRYYEERGYFSNGI